MKIIFSRLLDGQFFRAEYPGSQVSLCSNGVFRMFPHIRRHFQFSLDIRTTAPKQKGFKKLNLVSFDWGLHYGFVMAGKRVVLLSDTSYLIFKLLQRKTKGSLWVKATPL